MKVGKDYGIRDVGYYVFRELRIEKFYVYWGLDLIIYTIFLESGREFCVNFEVIYLRLDNILINGFR